MTEPRSLTPRQREILALAANGYTNQQIGTLLGVSWQNANRILGKAYRRLGANDRAHAVAIALAVGELGVHEIHIPDQQQEAAA